MAHADLKRAAVRHKVELAGRVVECRPEILGPRVFLKRLHEQGVLETGILEFVHSIVVGIGVLETLDHRDATRDTHFFPEGPLGLGPVRPQRLSDLTGRESPGLARL